MREEIAFMESANRKRQEKETTDPAKEANSSLPSPLPRPEYAISSGIIGADDAEVDFYVSCKRGHLSEVIAYVEHHQPRNVVLQYGLEQASFADQTGVVPYLLESGVALHSNVFTRPDPHVEDEYLKTFVNTTSIFNDLDRSRNIIALLEVFLDAGWHPDQPGLEPRSNDQSRVLSYICGHKLVVKFLIERLPGLHLESGGITVLTALKTWDTEFLDLLLSHGADATLGKPLFSIVERYASEVEKLFRASRGSTLVPVPFSQRRATAEWLLQHGVNINDVARMPSRDLTWPKQAWYDETALSLACAAEDYEFAEWFLEKGADPELLGGRALHVLWWAFPHYGKNDPDVAKELVEKVRRRHGGKLPSEDKSGH